MLFCCYLVCWFSAVTQTLVGLVTLTVYIMNLSSLFSILDIYFSLDVTIYGSVLLLGLDGFLMMKVSDYFEHS